MSFLYHLVQYTTIPKDVFRIIKMLLNVFLKIQKKIIAIAMNYVYLKKLIEYLKKGNLPISSFSIQIKLV